MYPFLNIPPNYQSHGYPMYRQPDQFPINFYNRNQERPGSYPKVEKSLKPPQIALSTQTIYRYRTFTLTLTVSEDWRIVHRLHPEDIIKAVMTASCHKESVLENHSSDEVKSCKICQADRKIIEIDHCDQNQIGPITAQDGLEKYTFNKCKSYCSSSRNHHHCRLCLVITGLPDGPYYSAPFVLQAREKRTSKATPDEFEVKEDQERLSATSDENDTMFKEEGITPLLDESVNEAMMENKTENKIENKTENKTENAVVVMLYMTNMEFSNKIIEHFSERVKIIEGVKIVKQKTHKNIIIMCVFVEKEESIEKVNKYSNDYIKNVSGSENSFNADLLDLGVVQRFMISDSRN